MNTRIAFLLAATLTVSSTGRAVAETTPTIAYNVGQPKPSTPPMGLTQRGVSRAFVIERLGPPAAQLSENIWVYWDYTATDDSAKQRGWDTLIVTFGGNKVRDLKLMKGDEIRNLLVRLQRNAAERYTANQR
jgi:hypothetical protein